MTVHDAPLPRHDTVDRVLLTLAVVLHLAIAAFPLPAGGLVAPAWYLVATAALWLGGAALLWRLRATAPRRAPLVPVGVLGVWVLGIMLGEQLLGWTA